MVRNLKNARSRCSDGVRSSFATYFPHQRAMLSRRIIGGIPRKCLEPVRARGSFFPLYAIIVPSIWWIRCTVIRSSFVINFLLCIRDHRIVCSRALPRQASSPPCCLPISPYRTGSLDKIAVEMTVSITRRFAKIG